MSKHDHPAPAPPCAHESLRFCRQCDAVECTACGKEWKSAALADLVDRFQRYQDRPAPYPKPYEGGPWIGNPKVWLKPLDAQGPAIGGQLGKVTLSHTHD